MAAFRFVAINAAGQLHQGIMDAPDEAAVVERLQRQGSIPMRAEPARTGFRLADVLDAEIGGRGKLRRQDVTDFTRELAIMLGAGQDLDRALRFLVETAPNARVRRIVERIRDAVRDGASLASALAEQPRCFSKLYVGMVRAGEAGGQLAPTLDQLASLLESQRRLAVTVSSALIYPALLTIAAIGSITLMLTQVLPQFAPLFAQSGAKLPGSTQFLIDAGAFVSGYGAIVLLVAGGLSLAALGSLRNPALRLRIDRLLLRLPIAGALQREIIAAHFTRTLGTLLQNGVPLIGALRVVRDILGNRAAVAAIDSATDSVRDGAGLSRSLQLGGIFPARTVHLLRLGEENAQLGTLALRSAAIHEERARVSVQRLVSLLVPGITIVMGAAIAGIVASLLAAMLSLNDLAQ